MMSFLIAEIFLKAAVLSLILYAFARHEADYSFQKVAMVTAGIALGGFWLEHFIPFFLGRVASAWLSAEWIWILGWVCALAILTLFVAFMVKTFCWVSSRRAVGVALVYIVFCIVFALATRKVKAAFEGEGDPAARKADAARVQSDLKAAMQFQEESFNLAAPAPVAAPEPVSPLPVAVPAETVMPIPTNSMTPAEPEPDVEGARKKLKISGIIRNAQGRPLALVNQQPIEEGETLGIEHAGHQFQWRLDAIRDGRAVWTLLEVKPVP